MASPVVYLFQSTRPVRGATGLGGGDGADHGISIHAPRAGRDRPRRYDEPHQLISIHAPRAGRDCPLRVAVPRVLISIHAPRAGRDPPDFFQLLPCCYFNPRAPCGARQTVAVTALFHDLTFQSTRPVRGATRSSCGIYPASMNFNPRAPCGARPSMMAYASSGFLFQSTRPVRGATIPPGSPLVRTSNFNPRAPCGARRRQCFFKCADTDFNPRAPCGARPTSAFFKGIGDGFQSTRPVRGATH